MQSQSSTNPSGEMSFEERQRKLEEEELIGERLQAEMVRMLGCPNMKEEKKKAFDDDEAHRKSIELAIEGSQQFRERMDRSLQKIETGMENVKTEMAELRKSIDAHDRNDVTSENEALCPTPGGSWWNPCLALQKWIVAGLVFVLLIIILIVLIVRK